MSGNLWKITLFFKTGPLPCSFFPVDATALDEIKRQWQNKERCVFRGPDGGVFIDWSEVYKIDVKPLPS